VIRETESDHFLTAEASDSNVRFTSYDDLEGMSPSGAKGPFGRKRWIGVAFDFPIGARLTPHHAV
jgi:hypothetical protein